MIIMKEDGKTKRTLEDIRLTYIEMDRRLAQAAKDLKACEDFISQFEAIRSNMMVLSSYYHSAEWLEDREFFRQAVPNEYFACAGEDSIWEVETEFYHNRIKAIKQMVDSL